MRYEFQAQARPAPELCARIAELAPTNPFYTPSFVAAQSAAGKQSWALWLSKEGEMVTGCTAFMTSGRLTRRLEIQSLPTITDNTFWSGLENLCREMKITDLVLNSFGSPATAIPRLTTETSRKSRREYVLPLGPADLPFQLSSNHRRNIARAQKAGLQMRASSAFEACIHHALLVDASLMRRQSRGERVPGLTEAKRIWPYVESRAAVLYQMFQEATVMSSVLVLIAERGAYYHSAGTSPEGMKAGASQFLIYSIAKSLTHRGFESFNLGGANESGLMRFKSGFGTAIVELEAASFFFGSPLKLKVANTLRVLRHASSSLSGFTRHLTGDTPSRVD